MLRTYQVRNHFPQQRLGAELMIFDHEADKVHVLNGTSMIVWECIRGGGSIDEADSSLRDTFEVEPDQDVLAMVRMALDQLSELGLFLATESNSNL